MTESLGLFFFFYFFLTVCVQDLKYILDACTKLTELKTGYLNAVILDSISPHLALQGNLIIDEEVPLEELKQKLPNLIAVSFYFVSIEYVTKFCRHFPLLHALGLHVTAEYEDESLHTLIASLSSLSNLRKLYLCERHTEDQIYWIVDSLPNLDHLGCTTIDGEQRFLFLSRMPHALNVTWR